MHNTIKRKLEKSAVMELDNLKITSTGKSPSLETYKELELAYAFFNEHLFDGKLPPCLITLQREKRTLGYLSHGRFVNSNGEQIDELAMNPSYFGVRSIKQTLSTLVHEQCHKYQRFIGKRHRAGYHDKVFSEIMEERGLFTSNTGKFGGKRTGQQMTHYIIKDGPFDKACDELIDSEFSLSWFDRFPPCSPMDLDAPLPSNFLVTTVAIQKKEPIKPIIFVNDDEDEDDFVDELGASRVDLIFGGTLGSQAPTASANDDDDLVAVCAADARINFPTLTSGVMVPSDTSGLSAAVNGTVVEDNDDVTIIEIDEGPICANPIDVALLSKPPIDNHSNRVKYRCPSCLAQVWGSPKRKLKCGEDKCNLADLTVVD